MQRDLTAEEKNILHRIFEEKTSRFGDRRHLMAYCTAAKELTLSKWNGNHPVDKNIDEVRIASGTTLKIVMVSRLGDCGLTDDLDAEHGYHLRVNPDDGDICDIRFGREPTWPDPVDKVQEALDGIIDEDEMGVPT